MEKNNNLSTDNPSSDDADKNLNADSKKKHFNEYAPDYDKAAVTITEEQYLKKKWGFWAISLFLLIPFVVSIFVYLILGEAPSGDEAYSEWQASYVVWTQLVSAPIIILIGMKVCKDYLPNLINSFKPTDKLKGRIETQRNSNNKLVGLDSKKDKREFQVGKVKLFYFRHKYVINIFTVILAYYILIPIISFFTYLIGGGTSENQSQLEDIIKIMPAAGFFMVVIAAPFVEEFMARYGIFNVMKSKKWAFFWSGSLFAMLHVFSASIYNGPTELLNVFPYLLGGFLFAGLYYFNDEKVGHVISVHALFNCISYGIIVASF